MKEILKLEHSPEVVLTGTLTFVDQRPALKSSQGTVALHMPDFFRYAYFEGFKADSEIQARGRLRHSRDWEGWDALDVEDIVIGGKTYIVVAGCPHCGHHSSEPHGDGHRDPAQA